MHSHVYIIVQFQTLIDSTLILLELMIFYCHFTSIPFKRQFCGRPTVGVERNVKSGRFLKGFGLCAVTGQGYSGPKVFSIFSNLQKKNPVKNFTQYLLRLLTDDGVCSFSTVCLWASVSKANTTDLNKQVFIPFIQEFSVDKKGRHDTRL